MSSGYTPPLSLAAFREAVTSVSADYTLLDSDSFVVVDCSGGAKIITVPTAVGKAGKRYIVKGVGASVTNTLTLARSLAETIDGATSKVLAVDFSARILVSDGTNWHLVSGLL